MKIRLLMAAALAVAAGPAFAGSYVLPDGQSRADGVVLHCATSGSGAAPCGTAASPLVTTAPVGSATSANQTSQITYAQAQAAALGTPADPNYSGGAGSAIALLKSIFAQLGLGVPAMPQGGVPVSRTLALVAGQSTLLVTANAGRHYIAFQAPQGSGIWVNPLGGAAGPNFRDCAYYSPGTLYESGQYVNTGAITIYSPVAATISAWEG